MKNEDFTVNGLSKKKKNKNHKEKQETFLT